MHSLILASGSPRRKELLQQVHLSFNVVPSMISEQIEPTLSPEEAVKQLAYQKAEDVWKQHRDAVVLGSDTVVAFQDTILGKPKDEREARQMLTLLSGRTHSVYTGVTLCSQAGTTTFFEKTEVEFYSLTEEEIAMYVESGEPLDKAGAYGIQGFGAFLVKQIKGDYYTVVGLPLARTLRELKKLGIVPSPHI
ncbi:Maf family protein [Halalkalibacter oceani]|uniref:dTTP/UTP pyrophosphatase n=1 Tax=Halalkalibacter oceani TaxID=1653776 RepID=A0A9X2DQJ6_9BACI|nr:Maf family protein [Halalkalibacter oceani]MCM3715094.1 Maf family protein [Halalkalibacter oceani]